VKKQKIHEAFIQLRLVIF